MCAVHRWACDTRLNEAADRTVWEGKSVAKEGAPAAFDRGRCDSHLRGKGVNDIVFGRRERAGEKAGEKSRRKKPEKKAKARKKE